MHLIVEPLELPWELSLFLAKNAAPYPERTNATNHS